LPAKQKPLFIAILIDLPDKEAQFAKVGTCNPAT
jgi:hypothetical protein